MGTTYMKWVFNIIEQHCLSVLQHYLLNIKLAGHLFFADSFDSRLQL